MKHWIIKKEMLQIYENDKLIMLIKLSDIYDEAYRIALENKCSSK